MLRKLVIAIAGLALLGTLGDGVPQADAAELTVTHFQDPVPAACTAAHCTLREAVRQANAQSNFDTIILGEGTYLLGTNPATDNRDEDNAESGDLDLYDGDVTIAGAGKNTTFIDAQQVDRLFDIFVSESCIDVTIQNLTLMNGKIRNADGGAIHNRCRLTLINVVIKDSEIRGSPADPTSGDGGGILNDIGAELTISGSSIKNNSATGGVNGEGGGIYNRQGEVSLSGSTISGNEVDDDGGGIFNNGTLSVTTSTISGNSSCCGGGINANGGNTTITRSTISSNTTSPDYGGGIGNYAGSVMLINNSTITGNSSANHVGGGIDNNGKLTIRNTTISHNTTLDAWGAITHSDSLGGFVRLKNSIVASNFVGSDCAGDPVTSQGFNLDSDGTCFTNSGTDVAGVNPQLGALLDHGGPTKTRALPAGSPATDTGNNAGGCPLSDQRGEDRPKNGDGAGGARCDRGAFERQSVGVP
ncbi:MAG: right-handed parallel beta-helix repeat-containing protein [Dehalococcoidia bacterium]